MHIITIKKDPITGNETLTSYLPLPSAVPLVVSLFSQIVTKKRSIKIILIRAIIKPRDSIADVMSYNYIWDINYHGFENNTS